MWGRLTGIFTVLIGISALVAWDPPEPFIDAPSAPSDPSVVTAPEAVTEPVSASSSTPVAATPRPARRLTSFDSFAGRDPLSGDPVQISRRLLEETGSELGLDRMRGGLRRGRAFASLAGHHVRFSQVVDGVPVYGSEVSVHLAPDGRPLLVNADIHPVAGVPTIPKTTAAAATAAMVDLLEPEGLESKAPRLVLLPEGRGGHLCWLVDTWREEESLRVFVSAIDLEPVRVENLRVGYQGLGRVFDPNPVKFLRNGNLKDNHDADSTVLRDALSLVTLERLDGSGFLRGEWADITATKQAGYSSTMDWSHVGRDDRVFEQVMAYYHIDRVQSRLRSLGLTNVNARPQSVDARGLKSDNSWYDPYYHRIKLGTGGVDDGEDADIICHEYGHAIQEDQVEDFGLTDQGAAMGEGFGDFLAAEMHATGDVEWDPLVASWDATSYSKRSHPCLRRVDEDLAWPKDFKGDVHHDGQIWSRFLWDLRGRIGGDDALRVVVESHFLLTPNADFVDGANAILVTNRVLREGRDEATIRWLLAERGIVPTAERSAPPPEEASEPNDDAADAVDLAVGVHGRFLCADEDWFRVSVAPLRRLRVSAIFDEREGDIAIAIRHADGRPVDSSDGIGGVETVTADAGASGAEFLVRVRPAGGDPVGYDLSVVTTDLETLHPGRTRMEIGGPRLFRLPVAGESRRMIVSARRLGRTLPGLTLTSPAGVARETYVKGTKKTFAMARRPRTGDWIVEIAPVDGEEVRVRVKVILR